MLSVVCTSAAVFVVVFVVVFFVEADLGDASLRCLAVVVADLESYDRVAAWNVFGTGQLQEWFRQAYMVTLSSANEGRI